MRKAVGNLLLLQLHLLAVSRDQTEFGPAPGMAFPIQRNLSIRSPSLKRAGSVSMKRSPKPDSLTESCTLAWPCSPAWRWGKTPPKLADRQVAHLHSSVVTS